MSLFKVNLFDSDYTENYKLSFCTGCVLTMFGTWDLGPAFGMLQKKGYESVSLANIS